MFAHATADPSGHVRTTVSVSEWAEPGRSYLFVATASGEDEAMSDPFRVTAGAETGGGTARNGGGARRAC